VTQDQKAERAVVHALGSGWSPVGRGSFPDRRGRGRRAWGSQLPDPAWSAGRVVLLRVCGGKYRVASKCCSGPRQRYTEN